MRCKKPRVGFNMDLILNEIMIIQLAVYMCGYNFQLQTTYGLSLHR